MFTADVVALASTVLVVVAGSILIYVKTKP